jgi:16S rRNA (cytidine1402-2'-O)-methyltransferase
MTLGRSSLSYRKPGRSTLENVSGTLYLVATPIGNLEDITLRALRILRECDLIACEDTRQTRKLLEHYGVHKPTLSYHEHNERMRAVELAEKLEGGANVALVSDAGAPLVSDPGYRLVAEAVARGVRVEPIPGPSAVMAALVASGLPTDAFHFAGFLPPRGAARRKTLAALKNEEATLIFFEAPHRIRETLTDIAEVMGARPVALAREVTKLHEQFLRGDATELLRAELPLKGEYTVLVGKAGAAEAAAADERPVPEAVAELERAGLGRMDAVKQVARQRGLSKREVYRLALGQE